VVVVQEGGDFFMLQNSMPLKTVRLGLEVLLEHQQLLAEILLSAQQNWLYTVVGVEVFILVVEVVDYWGLARLVEMGVVRLVVVVEHLLILLKMALLLCNSVLRLEEALWLMLTQIRGEEELV
jgi:hypothetical protein